MQNEFEGSIRLTGSENTVHMKLEKCDDIDMICDLTFESDAYKFTAFMMQSDAVQLAKWILKHAE